MIFVSPQRCGDLSMFCLGHEWTLRDKLYGIADRSIDFGFDLHEPIAISELSTFDSKVRMIPFVYSTDCFSMIGRYKSFQVLVKEFVSPYHKETMGIMHTFESRVNSSGMLIDSCRPR
jgi:hypothetical protein